MTTVNADRLTRGLHRIAADAVPLAASLTATFARGDGQVPRKTNELANSIRATGQLSAAGSAYTSGVVAPVVQARTTDKGARPHVIVARRTGGHLAFYWERRGEFVVLPRVNHPGNAAANWWRPVITRAYARALPVALAAVS